MYVGQSSGTKPWNSVTRTNGTDNAIVRFDGTLGEVVTNASAVTSVVTYALNGYYDSGWTNTLPGSAVQTIKSHNIGIVPNDVKLRVKCLTTEYNYVVGDIVDNPITTNASSVRCPTPMHKTYKTVGFTTYANATPLSLMNKTSGGLVQLTLANWAYSVSANRGW